MKHKRNMGQKKVKVVDVVKKIAAPFCEENGLTLIDVEFVKEGPHRYLRVMVDKNEGVSLDDCSLVSKFLNAELDKVDPVEENYFLEITSPGVERELKTEEDFKRFAGKTIQVKLFSPLDGQKLYKGTLIDLSDGIIKIGNDGKVVEIPLDKAAMVKLMVDFE
jgi:ribosome maturation factor RimP